MFRPYPKTEKAPVPQGGTGALVFDENSARTSLQTPLEHARTRFDALGVDKNVYPIFVEQFDSALQQRAFELELDDVQRVPRKDQDQIITDLLTEQDSGVSAWASYIGKGVLNMIPFVRNNIDAPKVPGRYNFITAAETNNLIRTSLGEDYKLARALPNGNTVAEGPGGKLSMVTPTGRLVDVKEGATVEDLYIAALHEMFPNER